MKLGKLEEELKELKDSETRCPACPKQLQEKALFTREKQTMDNENFVDTTNNTLQDLKLCVSCTLFLLKHIFVKVCKSIFVIVNIYFKSNFGKRA